MTTPQHPVVAFTVTIRLHYPNQVGMLGKVTTAIGDAGGDITGVDLVEINRGRITRDVTLNVRDIQHAQEVGKYLRKAIPGVRIGPISDPTFLAHLGGKIEIASRVPVKTRRDLSMVYT
ncbi:MAG: NAD-dependent malic enzyme, partial [Chloroflexi bacterium]|nr:NAD-dependent malic enzyme [Chloroflexota bacterium]